jgi:ABC-type lipoprotein release transport system permease subunit
VGSFLAYRQIKRASIWTTALIIAVMTLTFLEVVVINGVLVGLIQSSIEAQRERGTSDVVINKLDQKNEIENSADIIRVAESLPQVEAVSYHYVGGGKLNADYRRKLRNDEKPNEVPLTIGGIDPVSENGITNLSKYIIEGNYLQEGDTDGILIGANALYKYTPIEVTGFSTLKNVEIGQRIKVTVGKNSKEAIIRGFIKSKVDNNDFRAFMLNSEVRKLVGRTSPNYDEISIKIKSEYSIVNGPLEVKRILVNNGFDAGAKIQTWQEAEPKFLQDIAATFGMLGNLIGGIGLVVASITIFIVIFVNALTRRKFIGILKGIGIHPKSIEISYIIQSMFYAAVGVAIGFTVLYGFLVPFIYAHPINFPFSDGILYAPLPGTLLRAAILLVITIVAGYIPARMIVKRNTLDAILGR